MERRQAKPVADTVADNVRAFRQLRDIDQAALARRMNVLGIGWRQVTVSEVERGPRNVTVSELLALAFALGTTIEQLLDPRGPERIRGPWLSLSGALEVDLDTRGPIDAIPAEKVSSLVCTHGEYPVVEWNDENSEVKVFHWAFEPRVR
jgi:transcriptional regulator with XRE-family HTH domain